MSRTTPRLGTLIVYATLLTVFLAARLFAGDRPASRRMEKLDDLDGRLIGIMTGTIMDTAVSRRLDQARFKYFDNYHLMEKALRRGEIDAIMGDYSVLRQITDLAGDLRVLDGSIGSDSYGYGFRYGDRELFGRFNNTLARLKANGYLEELETKWVEGPCEERILPEEKRRENDGILRMGTCSVLPPFSYVGPDGRIIGFDIELAEKIAQIMDRQLVVEDMEFGELIPALLDGRVDVIGACISITPDRLRDVNFSDGYYRTAVGAMVYDGARPAEAAETAGE